VANPDRRTPSEMGTVTESDGPCGQSPVAHRDRREPMSRAKTRITSVLRWAMTDDRTNSFSFEWFYSIAKGGHQGSNVKAFLRRPEKESH
jgi:hypothetical protein